jgi:flavin prenyltransferase
MNAAALNQPDRIVLALTGASGVAYGLRLADVMLHAGIELHLVASSAACQVMNRETESAAGITDWNVDDWKELILSGLSKGHAAEWNLQPLGPVQQNDRGTLHVWPVNDFNAGIASGSFLTRGMVVCPCSMGTLAAIATGASSNLIHRAADVHLKEHRPLIVVPRELPLSSIQLTNMLTLSQAGATILPSMPGFYHQPRSVGDLIDFVVARICDHLRIRHSLSVRWGEHEDHAAE